MQKPNPEQRWGRLHLNVSNSKIFNIEKLTAYLNKDVNKYSLILHRSGSVFYINLQTEKFRIGRFPDIDFCLTDAIIIDKNILDSISRKHFTLYRDISRNFQYTVLIDHSFNGTFVNGKKIGKGKQHFLHHNDLIALGKDSNNMFVYKSSNRHVAESYGKTVTQRYNILKKLGAGGFGVVNLVHDKVDQKKYAMKVMRKTNVDQIMVEIALLCAIRHPCLMQGIDFFFTQNDISIIMELMPGGDLHDFILKNKKISDRLTKIVFSQVILAVKYLHQNKITHRDLKPGNILLKSPNLENSLVKVSDYGISKIVPIDDFMSTIIGTPLFMAPEILKYAAGKRNYTSQVDVWSLGVVLFNCLTANYPFSNQLEIIGGKINRSNLQWAAVHENAKSLIFQMLTVDPIQRITISKIFDNPWMQDKYALNKVNEILTKYTAEKQ